MVKPFNLKPGAAFGMYRIKSSKYANIEVGKMYYGYQYCAYLVCIEGELFYCKNRLKPVSKWLIDDGYIEQIEVEEIYLFRIKMVKKIT